MKQKPTTKRSLIEFKEKYNLNTKQLGDIFGFYHPNKWTELTKEDHTDYLNDLVELPVAIKYRQIVNDKEYINKIKQTDFNIEETYDNFNIWIDTKDTSNKKTKTLYSRILGKGDDYVEREIRRKGNQPLTVRTLAMMIDEAILNDDHETVYSIISAAVSELKSRGKTADTVEYAAILKNKEQYLASKKKRKTVK